MSVELPSTYPIGKALYLEACYQQDIAYMAERHFDHYDTLNDHRPLGRKTWWRSGWAKPVRELYDMMVDHSLERV